MATIGLLLSVVSVCASISALVAAALILKMLRDDAKAPEPRNPPAEEAETPSEQQKSVEQGIDNLMAYDLSVAKASLKGREG